MGGDAALRVLAGLSQLWLGGVDSVRSVSGVCRTQACTPADPFLPAPSERSAGVSQSRLIACLALALAVFAPAQAEPSRGPETILLPARMKPIYVKLAYPEGLVFDGSSLLLTDMKLGSVYRVDGSVPKAIWTDQRCGPTALAKLPSAQWLIACHSSHELVFVDLADPNHARTIDRKPFRRPNDMHASSLGVYVSRSGEFSTDAPVAGEIWLVRSPDDMRRVADGLHYANGVAVTRDGRWLLVSEHLADAVWRYPILPDGRLGERTYETRTILPHAMPLQGPDGIEAASDGSFFVAVYRGGTVLHVRRQGQLVSVTQAWVPSICPPGSGPLGIARCNKITNIALTPDEIGLYAVASNETETLGGLFYIDVRDFR
jgi:gluconolactonase